MDPISNIANVAAVVQIAGAVAKVCGGYIIEVHNARDDILCLQNAVTGLQNIVQDLQGFLQKHGDGALPSSSRLADSIDECLCDLQDLEKKLGTGNGKSLMRKFGLRSLKWPLKRIEVERLVQRLERYKSSFLLSLQVDQTSLLINSSQNSDLDKLEVVAEAEFGSFSDREEAECLQGTRTELIKEIMEWTIRPSRTQKIIFLLSGMAGTGKSTISRTVARALKDKDRLGASFFFKRGESDRGNAKKFFPTLLKQLVLQIPGLSTVVQKAIRKDPVIGSKALGDQFDKLLLQPLLEVDRACHSSRVIVIVVDALDECDHNNDIRNIVRLLPLLQNTHKLCIKVFMTSRPELPIRLGFSDLGDDIYQDIALHEISEEVTEHDIRLFLIDRFSKIRANRNVAEKWPDSEMIQSMVKISVPLFISAATMCRYIENSRREPMRRLKELLLDQGQYATKMEKTYLPILRQFIDDQEEDEKQELLQEFNEIIGTIILLATPFSVDTLSRFLNVQSEVIINHLDYFRSVLSVPGSPIQSIRILHLSFRDFLVQSKSEFQVKEPEKHREIALHSLRVMQKHLRRNICKLEPGIQREEIDPHILHRYFPLELKYSCRYWVHHLEHGDVIHSSSVIDHTLSFLLTHFLHWMEAMSLLGLSPDMIEMINLLQLVLKDTTNPTLSDFLQDAKRFILKNSHMADKAPLQIYYSGLMFAPTESVIRKVFAAQLPRWKYCLPEVRGWNAELQTFEGPADQVRGVMSVAFSPDGRLLASGWDDAVRIWDVSTGKLQRTLEVHSETLWSVAFSYDGQLLAAGSREHKVRLWDVSTGTLQQTLEDHVDGRSVECTPSVVFSPDNQLLASSADKTVRVWDLSTGEVYFLEGHLDEVVSVSFSLNSRFLASGSLDRTVRLWDISTGTMEHVQVLDHEEAVVTSISFSPDSKFLASASGDTVHIWNVSGDLAVLEQILEGHIMDVTSVAFSHNDRLLASASSDQIIRIWDILTGSVQQTMEDHSFYSTYVTFSPDGQLLASCCNDRIVRLWDTSIDTPPLERHSLYLIDVVSSITISVDGQLMASGSAGHTVKLWDASTNNLLRTFEGHSDSVSSVALSPNGRLLASGSIDGTMLIWDLSTGAEILRYTVGPDKDFAHSLAFSPDSRLLACVFGDFSIGLYDIEVDAFQKFLLFEESSIDDALEPPDLEFSQDATCLITTYGTIDIESGDETSVPKTSSTARQVSIEREQWITLNGKRILWLPPEARPSCSAVNDKLIALGHTSGRVFTIDFSL